MNRIESIEFYWRPGCSFCWRLERALNKAKVPMNKRNIWEDPRAAEFVRSVADGNETVPTVIVGSQTFVNPNVEEVVKALESDAPHLLQQ